MFCFIPPFVPRKAFNLSDTEGGALGRNDPREQDNVVLTPELDDGRLDGIVAERERMHMTA